MNEEKKPLSTQDIAGRQGESDKNRQAAMNDRGLENASSGQQARASDASTEKRSGMEKGYSESNMSNGSNAPLMPPESLEQHREHWTEIQTRFVDDPKDAVEQADELVAEVMQTVATRFADQRKNLEGKWQGGGQASSEDLRQALLQYRSFFERLLAA
jgi:hypothetical protein